MKVDINLKQFFLIDVLLSFGQVIHDEKVGGISFVQINIVNIINIWLTTIDDITEIVTLVKDIRSRIDKYFRLPSHSHL